MRCAAALGLSSVVSMTKSGTTESGIREWPAAQISLNSGTDTGDLGQQHVA